MPPLGSSHKISMKESPSNFPNLLMKNKPGWAGVWSCLWSVWHWNPCFRHTVPSNHFLQLLWKFTTKSHCLKEHKFVWVGSGTQVSGVDRDAILEQSWGTHLGTFAVFISLSHPLVSGSFYYKLGKIHHILGICPYWVFCISFKK